MLKLIHILFDVQHLRPDELGEGLKCKKKKKDLSSFTSDLLDLT